MIMMPYRQPQPSTQLTGQADFWHPARYTFTKSVA
jgi:hypothetical protein